MRLQVSKASYRGMTTIYIATATIFLALLVIVLVMTD
jgi:hypothetical protein